MLRLTCIRGLVLIGRGSSHWRNYLLRKGAWTSLSVTDDLPEIKTLIQINNVAESPLPIQNPYSKLLFGIKSLFLNRFSNILLNILWQMYAKYCWENILPPSKLNLNYLRKSILMFRIFPFRTRLQVFVLLSGSRMAHCIWLVSFGHVWP